MSVTLGKLVSSQIIFCRFYFNRLNSYYLAKAAVKEAIVERQNDITPGYDSLYELCTEREIAFENGKVAYYLIDEESKININTVSKEILARLPELSEDLANKITEIRSKNNFRVIEDILMIEGMDEKKFYGQEGEKGLRDLITVYGKGAVNINTAPYEVLSALAGEDSLVHEIIDFRKGMDGEESTEDDSLFSPDRSIIEQLSGISARDSLTLSQLPTTLKSENYTIKISTQIINRKGDNFSVIYSLEDNSMKLWLKE